MPKTRDQSVYGAEDTVYGAVLHARRVVEPAYLAPM